MEMAQTADTDGSLGNRVAFFSEEPGFIINAE